MLCRLHWRHRATAVGHVPHQSGPRPAGGVRHTRTIALAQPDEGLTSYTPNTSHPFRRLTAACVALYRGGRGSTR